LIGGNGRFSVLEKIVLAVEGRDVRQMMAALTHPLLALQRIRPDHASAYLNFLTGEVASSSGPSSIIQFACNLGRSISTQIQSRFKTMDLLCYLFVASHVGFNC